MHFLTALGKHLAIARGTRGWNPHYAGTRAHLSAQDVLLIESGDALPGVVEGYIQACGFDLGLNVFVEKLRDDAILPEKKTAGSAGWDLSTPDNVAVPPASRALVKLGFRTRFSSGFYAQILDRSGLALKGIVRCAGVIDSDYPMEWGVILVNDTQSEARFNRGERIAQVLFLPLVNVAISNVANISFPGTREGGFGSTG